MKELKQLLLDEQKRLEKIVIETKERLKDAPAGTLRMSKSHNTLQYYRCTNTKKSGTYINRNNIELARKLAQKSYDEKVLKLAEKRLGQIKKITKDYIENEIEEIYLKERAERQGLIEPIEPTWEQRVEKWKSKEYCFIGKTDEEKSVVCLTDEVPSNTTEREDGWKTFRIEGVLDFSLIGILSKISSALAEEKIGIFAVSTFNTDYIFVKKEDEKRALDKLKGIGYEV